MAKERLGSPRGRLFVALDLPGEVRDGLARLAAARVVRPRPAGRSGREPPHHPGLPGLAGREGLRADRRGRARAGRAPRRRPRWSCCRSRWAARAGRRPRLFAIEARAPGVEELQAAMSSATGTGGLLQAGEASLLDPPDRGAGEAGAEGRAQAGPRWRGRRGRCPNRCSRYSVRRVWWSSDPTCTPAVPVTNRWLSWSFRPARQRGDPEMADTKPSARRSQHEGSQT